MPVSPCGIIDCLVCGPYTAGRRVFDLYTGPPQAAPAAWWPLGRAGEWARWTDYPYTTIRNQSLYGYFQIGLGVPEVGGTQAQDREAQEAYRWQAEEFARARAEADAARAAAREKAEGILLRWLSPDQERDYRERGWFDVTGSDRRRWRILCQGQTGNVQLLDDDDEWTCQYCAHPRGLPDPAAWLAQAMAIAHDTPGFLAIANVYHCRSPETLLP